MSFLIRELEPNPQFVLKHYGIISGYIYSNKTPVSREVVIYRKHDWKEINRGWSDTSTGFFSFDVSDNNNVYYTVFALSNNINENSQIQDFITVG
jgi:hypothetical protein